MEQQIAQATRYIQNITKLPVTTGLILGSGLGAFAKNIQNKTVIPYKEIPHFPVSTVEGHAGELIIGELAGKLIVTMSGRFHYYEGYHPWQLVFPVRTMANLGIKNLIVTNAAGGINKTFTPGDLMLIQDHINLMGINPLIGKHCTQWGARFPDMTTAYTPALQTLATKVAAELNINLQKGIYLALSGPSFETPAEIKMLRMFGADAVGMSTVPEVIAARQMGLNILGISCITNMAAGIVGQPITHEEVAEIGAKSQEKFTLLLEGITTQNAIHCE